MSDSNINGNGSTDNQEPEGTSRKSILSRATTLGRAEGIGSNSRPGLFLLCCEGAQQRVISAKDLPTMLENFSKGLAEKMNVGYVPMTSETQQVSKLKTAITLGELTHLGKGGGLEIAQRAAILHKQAREAEKPSLFLSPFDALVAVARAQERFQPDVPLSDDQIMAVIRKPEKDLTSEADRLDKIATAMDKMINSDEKDKEGLVSEESKSMLEEILPNVLERIKELGGTSKQKKEKARQTASDAAVMAKFAAIQQRAG